jgi:hypothetical protein
MEIPHFPRETRYPHPGDAVIRHWRYIISFRDAHPHKKYRISRGRCEISIERCRYISKIRDM